MDCSSIRLDHEIGTVTVLIPVDFCGFVFSSVCFFFVLFAFLFRATLVCHVAIALCNIYSMRTGKTNSMDVMSIYSLR